MCLFCVWVNIEQCMAKAPEDTRHGKSCLMHKRKFFCCSFLLLLLFHRFPLFLMSLYSSTMKLCVTVWDVSQNISLIPTFSTSLLFFCSIPFPLHLEILCRLLFYAIDLNYTHRRLDSTLHLCFCVGNSSYRLKYNNIQQIYIGKTGKIVRPTVYLPPNSTIIVSL